MDRAVRGHDGRLAEAEGPPGPVGHAAARLPDEEGAGGHVPGMSVPLPVGVEPARRDVGQGEARAHVDHALDPGADPGEPLPEAPVAPDPAVVPERDRRASEPGRPGHADGATVEPRPPVALGHEQLAEPREQHDADVDPGAALEGDRHAEGREAGHEGESPVDGIHDPPPGRPGGDRPLLAEEADVRIVAAQKTPDDPLRRGIGGGGGGLPALEADPADPTEVAVEQPARGPRREDGRPGLRLEPHATSGRLMAWKIWCRRATSPRASSGVVRGRPPARTHSAKWRSSSLNASFIDAVTCFSEGLSPSM